jgi:hypothetical protein
MPTKKLLIMVLSVYFLTAAAPSYSQIIFGSPSSGSLQLHFSSWNITGDSGETKIEQWLIPVSGFIPIRDNFEARFHIAGSSNDLELAGDNSNLKGAGDLRVLFNHSFYDDRLLASIGMNIPTGKKKLVDPTERKIIEELSENYLTFPLRRLGDGFGFNILLGGATAAGPVRLGAGIMYFYKGSYEPYDSLYDPGDSYSINASADLKINDLTLVSNVAYTGFTVDKQNGIKAFKQSPQVDFNVGGIYASENYTLSLYTNYLLRGRHTKYDIKLGEIVEQLKIYGDEFSVLARFDYYPAETWYLAPMVETRLIAANEETEEAFLGSSSIYGFGGEIGGRINQSLDAAVGFKYYTGSADDGRLDLTGLQIILSLLASF